MGNGSRLGRERLEEILISPETCPKKYFNHVVRGVEKANGSFPLEDDTTLIQIDFRKSRKLDYSFCTLEEWHIRKNRISEILDEYDYSSEEKEKIIISADEMCINAVVHGLKDNMEDCVTLKGYINFQSVEFNISDPGPGFNPEKVPDPAECLEELMERAVEEEFTHGRGIWITRELMDSVRYNKCGSSVKIVKNKKTRTVRF